MRRLLLMTVLLLSACDLMGPDDQGGERLHVIDGDTVVWHGQVRNLAGIDAPELGQRCLDGTHLYDCGKEAAFALDKRARLETVSCEPASRASSALACMTSAGSLAELQVTNGNAYALPDAPAPLRAAASKAREAHLGVWRGKHVPPWEWREGQRLPAETQRPQACPIVVVEARRGTYLVPTDDAYSQAERDPRADRYCSDDAARLAGLRHYRVRS